MNLRKLEKGYWFDESLAPNYTRTFKSCVGKALYFSRRRPDVQRSVGAHCPGQ